MFAMQAYCRSSSIWCPKTVQINSALSTIMIKFVYNNRILSSHRSFMQGGSLSHSYHCLKWMQLHWQFNVICCRYSTIIIQWTYFNYIHSKVTNHPYSVPVLVIIKRKPQIKGKLRDKKSYNSKQNATKDWVVVVVIICLLSIIPYACLRVKLTHYK